VERDLRREATEARSVTNSQQQKEEIMAKAGTKKVRGDKRRVRDLGAKAATTVKGGQAPSVLMKACATGEHIKEATITVR
jgi:uncharacterized protein YjcR